MTDINNAAQPMLTVEEIRAVWVEHGLDDEAVEDFARAIESALLSKLRAPVAGERAANPHIGHPDLADAWQRGFDGRTPGWSGLPRDVFDATYQEGKRARAALASAPVARNNMRNPNLSRQGGWIKTDGFCDFLILAGIIGAIVGGILIPEVISFLWDFAKPWIHEVTK